MAMDVKENLEEDSATVQDKTRAFGTITAEKHPKYPSLYTISWGTGPAPADFGCFTNKEDAISFAEDYISKMKPTQSVKNKINAERREKAKKSGKDSKASNTV